MIPANNENEIACREFKHEASKLSEASFRRGFQQGLVAASRIVKGRRHQFSDFVSIAGDMRISESYLPQYLDEFIAIWEAGRCYTCTAWAKLEDNGCPDCPECHGCRGNYWSF